MIVVIFGWEWPALPHIPSMVWIVPMLLLGLTALVALARAGAREQGKAGDSRIDASWFREGRRGETPREQR